MAHASDASKREQRSKKRVAHAAKTNHKAKNAGADAAKEKNSRVPSATYVLIHGAGDRGW